MTHVTTPKAYDITGRMRVNKYSFTRVHDAIKIEIESNEFFDCTFATRRIKFNESDDRPDCVSWHILVTVNPCRVPPLLSSHTHVCVECQRTVAYSSIYMTKRITL